MCRVINSKNVLPVLADIVFTVEGDTLSLKASDSEVTLMADVPLTEASGEGSFAINAKNIMEAVKNLPDNSLTFSISKEDTAVKVDYFSGEFTLPIDNPTEFPVMPTMSAEEIVSFNIYEGVLQENIARTVFATADNELRPVMNGIFFDLTKEHLAVVASDGHQLVRNKVLDVKAIDDTKTGSFILPKKAANILKNILRKGTEETTVTFDGRQLIIATPTFSMQARLIEGRYPNYNSVIPQNNPNIVVVDRTSMIAALRRVAPFANDSSQLVRVHVENSTLQLDTEDYDFSKTATERMTCEYNGAPMSIGFKGTKTMEILSNINSTEIEIQLADPSRAALIIPAEQPEGQDILILLLILLHLGFESFKLGFVMSRSLS